MVNANIFSRESKYNFKTFILWSLCVSIFMFLIVSLYKSFSADISSYDEIIASMPNAFNKIFYLDKLSLSDILGFYGTEASLIYLLSGAIFAIMLGANSLSREQSEGTFEFLLSRPVSREKIVLSKYFSCLLYIILFNLIVTFASFASINWYNNADFSFRAFIYFSLAVTLAHIEFLTLGFFFSSFIKKARSAFSVSLGIVILMYILTIISQLNMDLEFLKYGTPFSYASPGDIISNINIEKSFIILPVGISIIVTLLTVLIYRKRNITP